MRLAILRKQKKIKIGVMIKRRPSGETRDHTFELRKFCGLHDGVKMGGRV